MTQRQYHGQRCHQQYESWQDAWYGGLDETQSATRIKDADPPETIRMLGSEMVPTEDVDAGLVGHFHLAVKAQLLPYPNETSRRIRCIIMGANEILGSFLAISCDCRQFLNFLPVCQSAMRRLAPAAGGEVLGNSEPA
jgi:hypothetical protein